jgi:hypothetical protein
MFTVSRADCEDATGTLFCLSEKNDKVGVEIFRLVSQKILSRLPPALHFDDVATATSRIWLPTFSKCLGECRSE